MYGKEVIELKLRDSYRNMREAFNDKMYIIEAAEKAIREAGYQPESDPMRGSQLTVMGLPTPNLGTGGMMYHGNHELLCINDMKEMVKIVLNLIRNITERE